MNTEQTPETKMKLYKAVPIVAGDTWLLVASCQVEAEKQLGDSAGQFRVSAVPVRHRGTKQDGSTEYVLIPCRSCPLQYGECRRPAGIACPITSDAPDIHTWIKKAMQAHLCEYVGKHLSKGCHQRSLKWMKLKEALAIYSRR